MRRIEEQMEEIRRRKEIYQALKSLRRKMVMEAVSAGACVALLGLVAGYLPELRQASEEAPIRQYGSMILMLPAAGYVLVAILSFALGVAVTLLCQHWKKWKEKEREIE